MTKFDKTQFAQFLTSEGFDVTIAESGIRGGIVDAKIETARGTLEVLATDTDIHFWKPNGTFKAYHEISNSQARARVIQTLKANATVWC